MRRKNDPKELRSVGLQDAESNLAARRRAEEELSRAEDSLERRTAELSRSLAMLVATLEASTDGILVTDGSGEVTHFNRRFADLWRVPAAILSSRDHRSLLEHCGRHFSSAEPFISRVESIRASAASESYDLLSLADGRLIERISRAQVLDGKSSGRVWIFRDITEKRHAEETSLRLAEIVDSSDDAIVSKGLDGVIRTWNEGARRIFGYGPEEVIGKPITILLPAERIREEEEILRSLQRGERVDHFETTRLRKDGRRIDISVTISPIRNASGEIIGASKIARDITYRKHSERTARFLADASAILADLTGYESTLQRIAGVAVPAFADWCAVDVRESDGTLRRLATAQNDPSTELLARELDRWYPPPPGAARGVTKVMRTGTPDWAEELSDAVLGEIGRDEEHVRVLRQLGWKSYICVPLLSRARALGAVTFVMAESGRLYDQTDVVTAQDLAARAAVAVENANLLTALQDADRRKDEFLAVLAHELRNPLAPLRNAVQILRAKCPPLPELLWTREVIDRQVEQMTRLVDDLLDVSRITQGRIELRKERVDLSSVIGDAVEASRQLIEKLGHELTVEAPAAPIVLHADPVRLAQVFLNLLNNAAKYTQRGGRIRLAFARVDDQADIRIADNGVGIPIDMLPRIFDMFTQADRSLEASQGGLGIGLTLAQRLVVLHGGTIDARSDGVGRGSEFIVRLPIAVAEAAADVEDGSGGESIPAPSRCRILIVDDNRDAADSLAMLLRMLGHEVKTAYDGKAAIRSAEVFLPRVILLDIGLPLVNGYEVGRHIRKQRGDGVFLVALTGWGQQDDRRRSKEAGFDRHLTKPVELDVLNDLLATVAATDRQRDTDKRSS